jgi:ABC-type spermidine/putrescine transport system permease subunit I
MKSRPVSVTNRSFLAVSLPVLVLQTCFFLVPLAITIALSFQQTEYFQTVWVWDLSNWREIFSKAYIWKVLLHTGFLSLTTVLICLIIAFPVCYAMITRGKSYLNHIKVLIVFAFLTDAILKTFGWVLFLDTSGGLNWLLSFVGIQFPSDSFLFTDWATVMGMIYTLLPFMIFTIFLAMENIDRDLLNAAADAGASKSRAFWEVTVPLCRPGIWAGSVLVFLYGMGSFLEPKVLGGGKSPMASELIRQTFEVRVNWPLGAALTLVLMASCIVAVLVFSKLYPATIIREKSNA